MLALRAGPSALRASAEDAASCVADLGVCSFWLSEVRYGS